MERLESTGSFKPEHFIYIIHIFDDTSDYILRLSATYKYKEVVDSIKKPCVCDEDVMRPHDIINYGRFFNNLCMNTKKL